MTSEPFAVVTSRDTVTVAGPDAVTFLQGQISQDVDALAVETSTWTFVLQPQGKVAGWARITKTSADSFLLDTDPGHGAPLAERLRRFTIRTNVEIDESNIPCVLVRGPEAPRDDVPDGVRRLPVAGPGVEGYDLVGVSATAPTGVETVPAAAYDAYRAAHGVPVMGRELGEDTIPAEVGQWIIDGSVSFTKGCFVGQELVARIDSRGGNVARHLRTIVTESPVEVGATIEADGPAGPVTTVGVSDDGGALAMAYLSRKVDIGATVVVGGVAGVVHATPVVATAAG